MFSPKEIRLRLLEIFRQREARGEGVFDLVIGEENIIRLPRRYGVHYPELRFVARPRITEHPGG